MNCKEFEIKISKHDQDIESDKELVMHLKSCSVCKHKYELIEETIQSFDNITREEQSDFLATNIMGRIESLETVKPGFRFSPVNILSAVAISIVGVIISVNINKMPVKDERQEKVELLSRSMGLNVDKYDNSNTFFLE